jgi:3-oxoacyl-[acyl-carrier protein] reductase
MSDFLVNLGANKAARDVIKKLGLPVPLPQKLRRASAAWEAQPLADELVFVAAPEGAALARPLAQTLTAAGATPCVHGPDDLPAPYVELGEAYGRPPRPLDLTDLPPRPRPRGLIYDASGLRDPAGLHEVYAFFKATARRLAVCGRALILARPVAEADTPAAAAAARALEGFTRSLAKELGRKGATAQVVYVAAGAEERLEPLLRFLLSSRSAYISGQPFHLSADVSTAGASPLTAPLQGKVALVTGAARGIGAAIAEALAREGARVIIMDRPEEEARTQAMAQRLGGAPLLADITDPLTPAAIEGLVRERFDGRLDVIVHNAGVTRDKMLVNMDAARWDLTLNINLIALMRADEALAPLLSEGGRVICLASIAGIAGNTGQTNYAASKAGVIGYVQAVAPTLAARGITVNAVAPGFIETDMTARIPAATREVARRLCNLSQGGLPTDVAETVTFLASPGAAGLTGQVVRICGGNFIGA